MAASECFTDSIYTLCLRVTDGSLQVYDQDNDEVLASFSTEYERDGIFNNKQLLESTAESDTINIEVGLVNKPQSFGGVIFDDWFLPSWDEIRAMRTNLHLEGVGGLSGFYWSSWEYDALTADAVSIETGLGAEVHQKWDTYKVRPARSFTLTEAVPSYALRDIGPAGGWIFIVVNNGDGTYTYYEAAPENSSNAIVWSNIDNVLIGTTSQDIGAGEQNTLDIIGQSGHTGGAAQNADDYFVTIEGGHILVTTEVEVEAGIVNETQGISLESDVDIDAEVSIVNSEQSISSEVAMQGKIEMSVVNAAQGFSSETKREADAQTSVINAGQGFSSEIDREAEAEVSLINAEQSINKTSTVNNLDIPVGWRLPTEAEWNTDRLSWDSNDSAGAFAAPIKLTVAGARNSHDGSLSGVGSSSYYWSSTVNGTDSRALYFSSSNAYMFSNIRLRGAAVRLIKETGLPLVSGDRSFTYSGAAWTYQEVESPTGRIWMDRNLGATQVATAFDDADAYGDLFQWGRNIDGHQVRTSGTTATLSSTDTPGHGDFITNNSEPFDWRDPQNDDLWQIDSASLLALQVIVDVQAGIVNEEQSVESELTFDRIVQLSVTNNEQSISLEANQVNDAEVSLVNAGQVISADTDIDNDAEVSIINFEQSVSIDVTFNIEAEVSIENDPQSISIESDVDADAETSIINDVQLLSSETDVDIDAEASVSNAQQNISIGTYLDASVLEAQVSLTNEEQSIQIETLSSAGITGGINNEAQTFSAEVRASAIIEAMIINDGQLLEGLVMRSLERNIEVSLVNGLQSINEGLKDGIGVISTAEVSVINSLPSFSAGIGNANNIEVTLVNSLQSFSAGNTVYSRGAMLHGAFFLAVAQSQVFHDPWIIPITGTASATPTNGTIRFSATKNLSVRSNYDVQIVSVTRQNDVGLRLHTIVFSCPTGGVGSIHIEDRSAIRSLGNHMGVNDPNLNFYSGTNTTSPIVYLNFDDLTDNIEKIRVANAYTTILNIYGSKPLPANLKYILISDYSYTYNYTHAGAFPVNLEYMYIVGDMGIIHDGAFPIGLRYLVLDSSNINCTNLSIGDPGTLPDIQFLYLHNFVTTPLDITQLITLLTSIHTNVGALPISIRIRDYNASAPNPSTTDIRDAAADISGTPAEQARYWINQILSRAVINTVQLNLTNIT